MTLLGDISRRISIKDLAAAKAAGEKWSMLTSYEQMTAEIFDEAGISPQRFRLITGNIIDVVGKLADANYDLVVIRSPKDMVDVVQESYRMLKAGGVLIIDNALDSGRVADPTQRDFETISRRDSIKAVKDDARWRSTIISIGGGVLLANKI